MALVDYSVIAAAVVLFMLSVFLSLDVFWCFVVFGLVGVCSFSSLTLLVGSFDP